MTLFIIIFFGILGALIGSFLNVVILRYNTGMGIGGRSGCFSCGKVLAWFELVPIFSFLIQKGKCLGCKSSISSQYPLVEGVTAFLFASIAYVNLVPFYTSYNIYQIVDLFLVLAVVSILVVVFVYDLRHKVIPDALSFSFAFFAIVRLVFHEQWVFFHFPYILNFLAGPILALPFVLVWYFSKGKWMGLGDGKLALGIGWFLGFSAGLSAVCLAFWIGTVVSLGLIVTQKFLKKKNMLTLKSEIPFAPFLIIGLLIVYFFPIDIFHINAFLSLF
jgi:prepilin signal peptidase PulO-like enzyme (type II secretory pathway)